MTHDKVIEVIISNDSYLKYCHKLASPRTHIAEDLYQETILAICETKDDRFVKAHKDGYLSPFVIKTIRNIWLKRNTFKQHTDGSTSPLMEYANTLQNVDAFDFDRTYINQISKDYDPTADIVFEAAKKIIAKDSDSDRMEIRYRARVYNHSNNNIAGFEAIKSFKNAGRFSQYIGIKRCAIYKSCREYQEILKSKLKYIING
jgi:hypothetical protein